MRIESSHLQLTSQSQQLSRYSREEQLEVQRVDAQGRTQRDLFIHSETIERQSLATYNQLSRQTQAFQLEGQAERLGQEALRLNQQAASAEASAELGLQTETDTDSLFELTPQERMRAALIQRLLQSITGKEIEFHFIDQRTPQDTPETFDVSALNTPLNASTPAPSGPSMSVEYRQQESFYQLEATQFQAQGKVLTQDGREIAIDLSLSMSRELMQNQAFSLRIGAALHDPLVINFDGLAAELSETRFQFDLTADGQLNTIPMLASRSAFLALDRNGDGQINDGSELFGARTGDGFAELAAYDQDGNQWIDENDPIFNRLLLWLQPGSGESQQLVSLKQAGIGAIYLGRADTLFHLQPGAPETLLGVIRSSSIFLSESGQAGSIQQVDLTI
ncbi:hypothetical protein [Nitrincola tapanii]|uniref:VCBS repeat-containing protein n=1 Tax=Nitrincola tapanii TaxID=1708751 RepID=A0A5A9W0M9_9GAMM|nr:hypothetical protein [Nitrincola tapanii]KAA0874113.1 hypothetical protein E1H14_10070 [Nitrincola tapanii]